MDGLTRYVLSLMAHFLWIVLPDGSAVPGLPEPLDQRLVPADALKARLGFLSYAAASHTRPWEELTTGFKMNPRAVCAYLNSSLVRYHWAVSLRSGVIEGYRAHVYPRTLEMLPWPVALTPEREEELAAGYDLLARLARWAKDGPNEWLLAETERRLALGHKSLTEPIYGLRFEAGGVTALAEELQLDGTQIRTELLLFAELADECLAEYVFRVLTLTAKEDKPITAADAQKLFVPSDYRALMREYRTRDAAFQSVEQDFMQALRAGDDAVYAAFGMTDQKAYIEQRLSEFPLNRLRPRYPWETVRPCAVKAHTEDRFR